VSGPGQPIGFSPEGYPVFVKSDGTVVKVTPEGEVPIGQATPPKTTPPTPAPSSEEAKSFSQMLLEASKPTATKIFPEHLIPKKIRHKTFRPPAIAGTPQLAVAAGAVADVEEPIYGILRFLGVKTPKVPSFQEGGPLYAAGRVGAAVAGIATGTYLAKAIGIPVTLKSVAAGAGLSLGASEAFKLATTGKHLTAEEAFRAGKAGAALTIAGAGYFKGLSKVAPVVGSRSLAGSLSRVAAASAFSGASSYVLSKGDVEAALVAAGLGAAVAGGIEVGAAKITPAAERWLTSRYLKSMEKGKLAWAGWKEKAVMKLTGAKPYVPRNIQVVPDFPYPRADILYKQIVSWEFAETPGTSMLLPSKYPEIPSTKAWVEAHVFKKPPTGGLLTAQQLMKEIQLIEHAAKSGVYIPGLPYIPPPPTPSLPSPATLVSIAGGSAGIGLLSKTKVAPKQPKRLRRKAEQILRPKPLQERKSRDYLDLIRLIFQDTRQKQKQKQRQTTAVIQGLRLKQKQTSPPPPPPIPTPAPPPPPPIPTPFSISMRGGKSRGLRVLFGKWFKREHRLPTARDIARGLFGEKRRRKKGKKRRGRRRRR